MNSLNLISPILVFVGTIITVTITIWSNHDKINANLKAQSRIQWIQEVRKITADLINSHYKLLDSTNEKDATKALSEVRRITTLFSLYFSYSKNDDSGFNLFLEFKEKSEATKNNNNLLRKIFSQSNKNKNQIITSLASSLEVMQNYNVHSLKFYNPKELSSSHKLTMDPKAFTLMYLNNFQQSVSLYLKIEWDRAKNNRN